MSRYAIASRFGEELRFFAGAIEAGSLDVTTADLVGDAWTTALHGSAKAVAEHLTILADECGKPRTWAVFALPEARR